MTESDPPVGAGGVALARLESLYREHYSPLVRLAHLLIGNRARAEELAQDAFVRLLPRLEAADNPSGYLRTIVVNLCRDEQRHQAVTRRHPQDRPLDALAPGIPVTSSAVWQALQQLPQRQREAVCLRYYADLPTEQIARILDVREATVRSLLHRGLTALKKVVPND